MFLNKQISLSLACAATYLGWALALGLLIVSWVVDSDNLGQAAIIAAIAAAVATSRLATIGEIRRLHNAITIVNHSESVTPLTRH